MWKKNYFKTNRSLMKLRIRKVLIAVAILYGLYRLDLFIFGEMGWVKSYRMEAHRDALVAEITTLKKDNARLGREVYALKTSPDYLETVARDKLGLARPGEIVYFYDMP
jgi:cell division protein FtsB